MPVLHRLDAAIQPYQFTQLPVNASIRQWTTEDGELLILLSRTGKLEIRDGGSGQVLRSVQVSAPFEGDWHEKIDKAILPDIKTMNGRAYVSLPHEGRIAVVALEDATLERYIKVGGRPTRVVLAHVGGQVSEPAGSEEADHGHEHEHEHGHEHEDEHEHGHEHEDEDEHEDEPGHGHK
jgi:hypothetical protein